MDKLNVAVVGTGAMGKSHARNYSAMDSVNLVAICDVDEEKAKQIAKEYNINYYNTCNEMIKKEKIDAVSICVPTKFHKEIAVEIIKNKIDVLVEKPIAATLEEAKEIINEADKNNVKLMVGHIERFNPVVMELKRRIVGNELGKIYKVNCSRLSPFPQRIVDVGVIVDLAIHEIDILRNIINSEITRVYAETARRIHSSQEDLLIGTIRFKNNVLGVINANWLTPKKVREITVTGEKGMFTANYLTQELCFYENDFTKKNLDYNNSFMNVVEGNMEKIKIAKKEPLKLELESFIKCIKKGTEPEVTGQDGIGALKIAEKFRQSAKENKVMVL
jgi:predicted dehydrogenase